MATIINPPVPYSGKIPANIGIGSAITVNGTVKPHCHRFTIDLKCCNERCKNTDIALHISVRFDGTPTIVRNTYLDDKWLEEERDLPLFPLTKGQIFGLIILNDTNTFKIAINGHHMAEYRHRLPYQCVKAIEINGDLKINQLSFQTMPVPNYSGYGSQKSSTFIAPVYRPALPFTQLFDGGLKLSTVRVFGKPVHSDKKRIAIDFRADTVDWAATRPATDIGFHISIRFDEGVVVLNNLTNTIWQKEQRCSNVFRIGVNFDLSININHQHFILMVNGIFCAQFAHRLQPISRITSMQIQGDVIVSSVQFT